MTHGSTKTDKIINVLSFPFHPVKFSTIEIIVLKELWDEIAFHSCGYASLILFSALEHLSSTKCNNQYHRVEPELSEIM